MTDFQQNVTVDTISIERDLAFPTYSWATLTFPCVPSAPKYIRSNDDGGFSVDRVLFLSVRIFDECGNDLYNGQYPNSQDVITFKNTSYRIQAVDTSAMDALLLLTCVDTNKGI